MSHLNISKRVSPPKANYKQEDAVGHIQNIQSHYKQIGRVSFLYVRTMRPKKN
jgi:hypothetical protein